MTIGGYNADVPAISASNYASTAYNLQNLDTGAGGWAGLTTTATTPFLGLNALNKEWAERARATVDRIASVSVHVEEEEDMAAAEKLSTRFVRVIVVDPNENIPLEDRVIFNGSEKMTDLNDQELFFELDIKNLLAAHNAKRIKVIDKKVKERTEYLEPAKIRDLKMVVVNIATF